MKVSVVIVSYNAKYHLEQCLQSVEATLQSIPGEIIVVDNNSPEKTVDYLRLKFPNVQFIESPSNLGFAKANNLGVNKAKGEFVLILNPDTLIPENLFEKLIPFADSKPEMGAVGVRLIDANGKFHPESKRNIPTLKNTFGKLFGTFINQDNAKGYYKTEVGEFETAPAEILVGAFMFLRKEVYRKVGGFDARYFMYGEDIDLSYTLELNGFRNYYFGETTVIHYKGESTRKDKKYLKIFFGAMQIFIEKYYKKNWVSYILFSLGLRLRFIWANFKGAFKPEDIQEKEQVSFDMLENLDSENEISAFSKQILLDGGIFSHQERIEIISKNAETGRSFFIRPKNATYFIGDSGVHFLED